MAAAPREDPIKTPDGLTEFLDRTAANWPTALSPEWNRTQRPLHTGRNALLVHYQYVPGSEALNLNPDVITTLPHTRNLMLKINYARKPGQGRRHGGYPDKYTGMRSEAEFLASISGFYERQGDRQPSDYPRRPQNIIRQYSTFPVNGPRGLGKYEISMLEYCPGLFWDKRRWFNLSVFDQQEHPEVEVPYIDEIDIWGIFKQLTRMVSMLDSGNEVPQLHGWRSRQPPDWKMHEICHYDIEPKNILIGYKENSDDRLPMLKLCDFDDALHVPHYDRQTRLGRYRFPNQPESGRAGYRAPEAVIGTSEMCNPFRNGTCSNIFQIANIIRVLMHCNQSSRDIQVFPESEEFHQESGEIWRTSKHRPTTYGISLKRDADVKDRYSGELRTLVKECMREKPSLRPRMNDLWLRVGDGYHNQTKNRKGVYNPLKQLHTFPPTHPIFDRAEIAPNANTRTPAPGWHKYEYPATPQCPSPRYKAPEENLQGSLERLTHPTYEGDDIRDVEPGDYPRTRAPDPPRHPHGYLDQETRASVNVPEAEVDKPGCIGRNLGLMGYYERMGNMWMGEDIYYKMLEAGLDPKTYNWDQPIPDPDRELDRGPLSGTEFDEGDDDEDWDVGKWDAKGKGKEAAPAGD